MFFLKIFAFAVFCALFAAGCTSSGTGEGIVYAPPRADAATLAKRSGELAAANLNIATMRVFRRSVGGDAMVALELDGSADTELIARLSALQGVYHVAYLAAKEE